MANYEADVVIVGGGVAGLLAGWRLIQTGASVLVLEAGPRVNRAEALENFRLSVSKDPQSPYPSVPYAPHPTVADLRNGYFIQDGPETFGSTYTRRLGGSTWHWLGTSMRHLPNDFRLRSLYGVAVDWPIAYEDLLPWYDDAEQELGVAGDSDNDLGSPRDRPYPMPPLRMTYLDERLKVALAPLGMAVEITPQARNSVVREGRPPCCGNATCVPICPIAAKYDTATVHVPKFERLGGQILVEAVANFVEVGPDGLVRAIHFKHPDGSDHTAVGRVYVIAAHAIETPKLLLISQQEATPSGVANSSDQVGRNLMDHPSQVSWALAEDPVYPYRAPLENAGIELYRDDPLRSERSAFRIAVGEEGWVYPGISPTALATELIGQGLRGRALRDEIDRQVSRQFRFACLIEQMPDPNNRIVPDVDQTDALGIPRPRITYDLDEFTWRGLAAAREACDRIFDAFGVTERHHGEDFFGAGHVIGTHRMGDDPTTSVVDGDQRAHDHPNLFLLGSGTFPTAGTANPTLTLAALALRTAETIRRDLAAGVATPQPA